jgi:hypothetical protein
MQKNGIDNFLMLFEYIDKIKFAKRNCHKTEQFGNHFEIIINSNYS